MERINHIVLHVEQRAAHLSDDAKQYYTEYHVYMEDVLSANAYVDDIDNKATQNVARASFLSILNDKEWAVVKFRGKFSEGREHVVAMLRGLTGSKITYSRMCIFVTCLDVLKALEARRRAGAEKWIMPANVEALSVKGFKDECTEFKVAVIESVPSKKLTPETVARAYAVAKEVAGPERQSMKRPREEQGHGRNTARCIDVIRKHEAQLERLSEKQLFKVMDDLELTMITMGEEMDCGL